MAQAVAERANINDNIVNAAKLIGRSKQRRAVFEAIYFGKALWKSVTAIAQRTGLPRKRVLEEGKRIVGHDFASQEKIDGETSYSRDQSLYQHKAKILAAAGNKKKLAAIPTRVNPHIVGGATVRITLERASLKPRKITVDDVASFKAVESVKTIDSKANLKSIAEVRIKNAFKAIIGETHDFKDWGGEKNDLFTNKLRLASTRKDAAFAFKGKATQGTLTPKKMGKNGDQVGRLFSSEADVFFVVYHSKVDESVHNQMFAYAVAKSLGGRAVSYGIIDGDDLNRLYQAYRKHF
jgi:hypothetical protein